MNVKGKQYYDDGNLKCEGEFFNDLFLFGKIYGQNGNLMKHLDKNNGRIIKFYQINNRFECDYLNGKISNIKEYNYQGLLIFEGEYINGNKNGKVKEYKDGNKLIFEGEYLNGIKNGKCIEYEELDTNKFSKIKCEYINGQINGKVEEYWDNDILKFEGEYINGKKIGKGKNYDINGNLLFEGEYLYDFIIKGKQYIKNKLEYVGEYLYYSKWNGKGYDENGNIKYELINGNGKVVEYFSDFGKLMFEGEYLNGKKYGKGKQYLLNGSLYFEGEYLNGKRNGHGKEYYNGNLKFEGEYLDDERIQENKNK